MHAAEDAYNFMQKNSYDLYLGVWSPVLVHDVWRSSDEVINKLGERRIVSN